MADSSTGTATLPDRFLQRPNTYVLGRGFKLHFFGEPSSSNQFTELANLAVPCTQAWNSGSEDAARAARAKLFESDLIDRLLTSTHQAKHHDDHLYLVGQVDSLRSILGPRVVYYHWCVTNHPRILARFRKRTKSDATFPRADWQRPSRRWLRDLARTRT